MNFEEHLHQHQNDDGTYDLVAAEESRRDEIKASPQLLDDLARKAASNERRSWESRERQQLQAQFKAGFAQGILDLDLTVLVPLGDSVAVELGDMDLVRIQLRKDLRTKAHLDESEAFVREMEFWFSVEKVLPPDSTLGDLA